MCLHSLHIHGGKWVPRFNCGVNGPTPTIQWVKLVILALIEVFLFGLYSVQCTLWRALDAPCVNSATVLASPFQSTLQVVSNDPWGYFVKSSTLVGLTHKGTHSTWPTKHNTNWVQTGRLHWTRRDTISQACK